MGLLQPVRVLIFIDENMIEAAADVLREGGLGAHLLPPAQQIVVVKNVLRLLGLDVGSERLLQLRRPFAAPRGSSS